MKNILIVICTLVGMGGCRSNSDGAVIDNRTVQTFDVARFVGKWYEIARYDHRFEEGMTRVSATYTLLDDGRIEVVNEGRQILDLTVGMENTPVQKNPPVVR